MNGQGHSLTMAKSHTGFKIETCFTRKLLGNFLIKGLGSIRGYFGLNIFEKLNTFV